VSRRAISTGCSPNIAAEASSTTITACGSNTRIACCGRARCRSPKSRSPRAIRVPVISPAAISGCSGRRQARRARGRREVDVACCQIEPTNRGHGRCLEGNRSHRQWHSLVGCVPARRGGMCQGVTANGTRSTGGSGIGATQWSGRVLLSSPSS
jgi:hypothetical protein